VLQVVPDSPFSTALFIVLKRILFFFEQVNGVAELHSNILKQELFADYVSIWPTKFQNKTNGITPRRWLRFCNPELSEIVTKWLKSDQWTSNLDLLTGLRKVCANASNLASACHCSITV
jgi:glucan phosphorylase